MNKQYLDPKQPLDIEPAADRNVERVTDCCLDASPKMSFFLGKGRGGGAWWMIWMLVAFGGSGIPFGIYIGRPLDGLLYFLLVGGVFGLSLLWPIHVWKTHYPIRFSRKTRKVYCHWYGKTYIEDWDTIKAYIQVKTDFNAQGAPGQTPQINIEFHNDDGSVAEHSVIGTDKGGLYLDEQAAAFWEYIRQYMEEGPEKLPAPKLLKTEVDTNLSELRKQYLFPKLWDEGASLFTKLLNIALLPFFLVWIAITYPTEVLYYFLDKHVKMKPFPPEMAEACPCDEEVVARPKETAGEAAA